MPVVIYSVTLGDRPAAGTRDRFIEWLEEHVGPAAPLPDRETYRHSSQDGFDLMLARYLEASQTKWEYADGIMHILIATGGEDWYIWQVKAETPRGPHTYAYRYEVHITDELLAVQFKLACL